MIVTDVFVVGAGPCGLAAAIAARQRGFSVMTADIRRPPIDKACGEGVLPGGVAALRGLGVAPCDGDAVPFRGIRFVAGGPVAAARFPEGPGLGMRRVVLHRLLIERAADAGVVMRWGKRADIASGKGVRLDGEAVRSEWIVGADGHNSRLRQAARLSPISTSRRLAVRQHYAVRPWTDFVEVYWHERGQAYVTPVGPNEVCVALIGRETGLRMTDISDLFPELAGRLKGASPTSAPRGGVSTSLTLRSVARDRIALVGDASGSVDAITGDGLSLGFRQAIALADALAKNDLALYRSAHRRVSRVPRLMARALLAMGEHAWLRRRAIGALAAQPQAFTRFLGAHAGVIPPTAIGPNTVAGFIWRLLTTTGTSTVLDDHRDACA